MNNVIIKTKKERPSMELLKDGTVCYTKPVRYPNVILRKVKKLWYEKDFSSMSEAIFYCIEKHEKYELLNKNRYIISKEDIKPLTVRFREHHYNYVLKVCETKGLGNFTDGVIYILDEYFNQRG